MHHDLAIHAVSASFTLKGTGVFAISCKFGMQVSVLEGCALLCCCAAGNAFGRSQPRVGGGTCGSQIAGQVNNESESCDLVILCSYKTQVELGSNSVCLVGDDLNVVCYR